MAPNPGVLDTVLNTFRTQIDSGIGALTGPVQGSLALLIVISVASMSIFWAIDETSNIFGPLFRKILLVGFWTYMILNWQSLAIAAATAFGKLGIAAGGGSGLGDFLNNPSKVVAEGLKNAQALWDYGNYQLGAKNTPFGPPPVINPLDVMAAVRQLALALEIITSCVVMLFAYGWLALEIVVTVIEFHIVVLITFIALPFGVLARTSALAERSIGYVISAGFKIMSLGVIIGLGSKILEQYLIADSQPGPTYQTLMVLPLIVFLILMLAIQVPRIAAAVVGGAPTMGAGGLVGAALGTAGAALAGGSLISAAGKTAAAIGGRTGGAASSAAAAAGAIPTGSSPGAPQRGASAFTETDAANSATRASSSAATGRSGGDSFQTDPGAARGSVRSPSTDEGASPAVAGATTDPNFAATATPTSAPARSEFAAAQAGPSAPPSGINAPASQTPGASQGDTRVSGATLDCDETAIAAEAAQDAAAGAALSLAASPSPAPPPAITQADIADEEAAVSRAASTAAAGAVRQARSVVPSRPPAAARSGFAAETRATRVAQAAAQGWDSGAGVGTLGAHVDPSPALSEAPPLVVEEI